MMSQSIASSFDALFTASPGLNGVIGVVAENSAQLEVAVRHKLRCVEIRADLLYANGHSIDAVEQLAQRAKQLGLAALFTLRHQVQGGCFDGSESERVDLALRALDVGCCAVDVEFDTGSASELTARGVPVVLSHHDFESMLSERVLAELSEGMRALRPAAMKVVPTGNSLRDAACMLKWVAARGADEPRRIGFAMGAEGAVSRILALAFGSPLTYASIGASVAPGQISLDELCTLYRAAELNAQTRCYGIVGSHALSTFSPYLHNPALRQRHPNAVYLPLQTESFNDLLGVIDELRIDGLSVTIPYKEEALAFADQVDDRSRACGAANTLVFDRDNGRRARAYNTDFDGVIVPIARCRPVAKAKVAVIGNGGAARGAVQALKEAGATVHLFYRNAARGEPVARDLDVSGNTLDHIDSSFDVYVNATPLGAEADDPSPVPATVFTRAEQIAFDMVYLQPRSAFLADAEAAGAHCIRGNEMLIAQGTTQFGHFLGTIPSMDELAENYARGVDYRNSQA